ncbi:unnamed protein product [Alternaria sp. RS040]
MPFSVPTNRATIPGISRSQPRWDPEDVLNLCVNGRCLGYAPSRRRECRKQIRFDDVDFLVTEIARKQPDPERIRPDLVNLANVGLCHLHLPTQGEALVNKWTSNIRAAFPVELDRMHERRSAMQGQPAAVAFTPAQLEIIRAQIEQIVQQVRQELEPSNSATPPRYNAASSAAAESVNAPSEIPPTPSTSLGRAARSAVNTTPRIATASARSSNRPDITAAPVGRTEAILGRTSSSSATSLPNVSQVVPRPSRQRCPRPHARRLPLDEECPICYEGGLLSDCDASDVDATGAGHYPWGPRSPSTDTQALEDWNHLMRIIFPLYNQWTLLQTLGLPLQDEVYMSNLVWRLKLDDSWCNKSSSSLINGTEFFDCLSWDLSSFSGWNTSSSLQGTVFDTSLNMPYTDQDPLDPRTDINVTEDLLNSVSTNITICLVAAITFAAIAIWSLSRNGTPAADGGFLQIMTATRGNAEMERLVLREKLTAVEDMSVELKALKVRYGELVGEDVVGVDGRTVGFGTIEETISLRKRK